jgi:hypothetical protein
MGMLFFWLSCDGEEREEEPGASSILLIRFGFVFSRPGAINHPPYVTLAGAASPQTAQGARFKAFFKAQTDPNQRVKLVISHAVRESLRAPAL